ncbi:MAG: TFIIB-type zinc ribbon-containing protein [Propionibacteriaceae bacterium]|jgi:DNA-directed RNA polymerase subunit RPC12/RpoP|nr:TFIIB-type zinc ribbon-containing protein [Propionibacteriaceae bacterium]
MTTSVLEYKCPACGGLVAFDPASGQLKCASCGTAYEPDSFAQQAARAAQPTRPGDPDQPTGLTDQISAGQQWSAAELAQMREYVCPSCGGQILADPTTAATHCPYCDSPTILAPQIEGQLRPDLVAPFKVPKERVVEALVEHVKSKRLAPKLFRDQARIESVRGVYVPFWLYDFSVQADYQYDATRVTHWSDAHYDYTKTDYYRLRRAGQIAFSCVPVDGASNLDDTYMEAIEPFDHSQAVPFEPTYLLGYLAQKYDVDVAQTHPRAVARVTASTEAALASTVNGYSSCSRTAGQMGFPQQQVRYALMPVWMLSTVYRGKPYVFAMNGQSGRFIGVLPISWGRFWAWFAGLFIGLGAGLTGLVLALGQVVQL